MKFHIYRDRKGEHRFRMAGDNGEKFAASEGYKRKASITKIIGTIINDIRLGDFEVVEVERGK